MVDLVKHSLEMRSISVNEISKIDFVHWYYF